MRMILSAARRDGKGTWVAEITGTDQQYGLARRFLQGQRYAGIIAFELEPGRVYDVAEPAQDQRKFVTCSVYDQKIESLSFSEVLCKVEHRSHFWDDDWEPEVKKTNWTFPPMKVIEDEMADL
jgi:hypothetical protein